jgi:hypothetical protein
VPCRWHRRRGNPLLSFDRSPGTETR